jgi:hypothetical protein
MSSLFYALLTALSSSPDRWSLRPLTVGFRLWRSR